MIHKHIPTNNKEIMKFTMFIAFAVATAATVTSNDVNHLVKESLLVCRAEVDQCALDENCTSCLMDFDPKFTIYSLESCEQLDHDMTASMGNDCNTTNTRLKDLEICIEDEVFYILTLKTVKHMCSNKF